MKYDFKRDLIWLISRPWILVPRFIQIVGAISLLLARLIFQGSSNDDKTQKSLAKFLLKTLIGLGPCFIKVGQALSTRPDLIRKDWLEELTNLQDNLPSFPHEKALKIIESELGKPANEIFEEGGVFFAHGFEKLRKKFHVREFEKNCQKYFKSKYCLMVSSGTAAIKIGFKGFKYKAR